MNESIEFVEIVLPAPLSVHRNDVEDAFMDIVQGNGGEVTGAGVGRDRVNLDVAFEIAIDSEVAEGLIRSALQSSEIASGRFRFGGTEHWFRFDKA